MKDPNEINLWVQCVLAQLHGTAHARSSYERAVWDRTTEEPPQDDYAGRRAMAVADAVVDGFRERVQVAAQQGSGLVVAKPKVPKDLRGKR